MRVLLLILLFMVWEAWSPEAARLAGSPTGGGGVDGGVTAFGIGYGLLVAGMGLWGRRVAHGSRRGWDHLDRRVDRFNWGMTAARVAVPAWFAVGVFRLGWRSAVEGALGRLVGPVAVWPLVTPGTVVGLLPGFAAWAGLWWSQYPVDRALKEQGVLYQLEADLPVFAPPPFASYFVNKLRAQLLFTVVPMVLILAVRDGAVLTAAAARGTAVGRRLGVGWPPSDRFDSAAYTAAVVVVLVTAPVVLRHVLSTRTLPDSRLRRSLDQVLDLAGVRCRDVLLWRTHNNVGNAAVMGLLPAVRYVMLSDLLLEGMTDLQVRAVFAHELGHVRHRHLAWFAGVFGAGLAALYVAGDWATAALHPATEAAAVGLQLGLVVVAGVAFWTSFGMLSRWFERQADVFAARLVDRAGAGGNGAAENGAAVFASALRRVAVVNNISYDARNWTHGSIAARAAYIERFAADPAVAARFDRRGKRTRAALLLFILACTAAAVAGARW